jgi:hypothetical protein
MEQIAQKHSKTERENILHEDRQWTKLAYEGAV